MPFEKRYETSEVREIMRASEGAASPVTGAPAHARTFHALATPGGFGTDGGAMDRRVHKQVVPGGAGPGGLESNAQFNARGGKTKTSAFKNLLQQASAVTQALNAPKGQAALAVLDAAPHAALALRVTLRIAGIRQAGFLPASGAPGGLSTNKNAPSGAAPAGISAQGVMVILDRGPNGTHFVIQTCYPLDACAGSTYEVKDMGANTVIASG